MFGVGDEISVIDGSENWKDSNACAILDFFTCIFNFRFGKQPYLLENFVADPNGMEAKHQIEQAYLQNEFSDLKYWPREWAPSFKYSLRRPVGVGLVVPPHAPPAAAKVMAFHGKPRPIDLVCPGWWSIAPYLGRAPVKWAKDYFFNYGGD